jgi:hypothetical protein
MRIMILDDAPWIAELLKQIVLSLRPAAEIACLGSVAEALANWQAPPTTPTWPGCAASPGWPDGTRGPLVKD